jgi:hypothetical protein
MPGFPALPARGATGWHHGADGTPAPVDRHVAHAVVRAAKADYEEAYPEG